jgi:hypothetical protein
MQRLRRRPRRQDRQLVTIADLGLQAVQVTDVVVVEIDVHELME